VLGGGTERAGSYFPHDEFYDASTREVIEVIARLAPAGARVASETPELFAYYAQLAGRADLRTISLSDRAALRDFGPGDVLVIARGRRYFSNDELTSRLEAASQPSATVSLGSVESARIYVLDHVSLGAVSE
jgi:hypothetical protein